MSRHELSFDRMQIMSGQTRHAKLYLHAALLLLLILGLILRGRSIRSPLEGAPCKHYHSVKFCASDCRSVCLQSHIRERFSHAFLCVCVTHLLSG